LDAKSPLKGHYCVRICTSGYPTVCNGLLLALNQIHSCALKIRCAKSVDIALRVHHPHFVNTCPLRVDVRISNRSFKLLGQFYANIEIAIIEYECLPIGLRRDDMPRVELTRTISLIAECGPSYAGASGLF